ncbi:hypothetical protein DESPIG_00438 [Desulfovibrio piger ATCC 29098]|uniref:Uncharacterized protein n=1 Tax=Desulfovibrio piger ATCC 29098 TaxID=411464 RepID=B6WQV9_9BACT|nr:hypothetical protein DESPIG_00438 [Desulfovibrio piger ATCC 29098]
MLREGGRPLSFRDKMIHGGVRQLLGITGTAGRERDLTSKDECARPPFP